MDSVTMPRVRWETSGTDPDPWLYAAGAAELAGITARTWRNNSTPARRAGRIPLAGRRCPDTGRRQWLRSAVLEYVRLRDAGATRQGVDRHAEIEAARARIAADPALVGEVTAAHVASALDMHPATVAYHLSGRCSCPPLPAA